VALILVVDDHPGVRAVICRVLLKAGHHFVLAVDGVSGLATYHQLAPDVALVDQLMPEMDGFQLMRQSEAVALTMPVLLTVSVPSGVLEAGGPVRDVSKAIHSGRPRGSGDGRAAPDLTARLPAGICLVRSDAVGRITAR
jgi:CheY-like chemotaxis protein